jgi:hypothetical protein
MVCCFLNLENFFDHVTCLRGAKIWDQLKMKTKVVIHGMTGKQLEKVFSGFNEEMISPSNIVIYGGNAGGSGGTDGARDEGSSSSGSSRDRRRGGGHVFDKKTQKKVISELIPEYPELKNFKIRFAQNQIELMDFCTPKTSTLCPFAVNFDDLGGKQKNEDVPRKLQHLKITILSGKDLIACDPNGKRYKQVPPSPSNSLCCKTTHFLPLHLFLESGAHLYQFMFDF